MAAGAKFDPRIAGGGVRRALRAVLAPRWPGRRVAVRDRAERVAIEVALGALERSMRVLERAHDAEIASVHPDHRADATNLVHYLAVRNSDVRALQRRLGAQGLSSLGRCEPSVRATVQSAHAALHGRPPRLSPDTLTFTQGRLRLDRNTDALLGPRPEGRVPRIMVTLPSEAADDVALVRHLLESGMDIARINGAHDDVDAWESMARNVREASAATGRACRISVDLPGPKVRTGALLEGPRVLKLRPERDQRGVAVAPATAELVACADASIAAARCVVDPDWLARRSPGDVVDTLDTRASPRSLSIVALEGSVLGIEARDTTYLETGSVLSCGDDDAVIGALPQLASFHLLAAGDRLVLTRDLSPATPWRHGQPGTARIGCTLGAVFERVRVGDRVVLDDGRLSGAVAEVGHDEVVVELLSAPAKGGRLRAEKGINLPDTELGVPAVGDEDLPLLGVAAAQADMVALSFLRDAHDVDELRRYLDQVGGSKLGLVVKIETMSGFARLPEIVLHAMRSPLVGVMIARGDLAVEAGYERLAEIQEEILWLCEAAHVPVIWATEVLDQLARTGQPSRAEVTDAAMSQRAECVMLNKGPHIDEAIVVLDDILRRMAGHQRKKTALLRPLRIWADA